MHGASYVLVDGKTTYQLTDQKTAASFAAKQVTVTGTIDEQKKTITVTAIADAK